jgi:hypothetical protein
MKYDKMLLGRDLEPGRAAPRALKAVALRVLALMFAVKGPGASE